MWRAPWDTNKHAGLKRNSFLLQDQHSLAFEYVDTSISRDGMSGDFGSSGNRNK